MKARRILYITVLALAIFACEERSRTTHNKQELDRIVNEQARAMIMSGLGRFSNAADYSGVSAGGPVSRWFWFPWAYGGGLTMGISDPTVSYFSPFDTSYYDPGTGFWVYRYEYEGYSGEMKYRFEPRDANGFPTDETNAYEFESDFSGQYSDGFTGIGYSFNGSADYSVSGFKNWDDSANTTGELVFNGHSESTYHQLFSPDTTVEFTYSETTDNVRLKKEDCFPYTGTSEYSMIQDATPDTFSWTYYWGWSSVDSGSGDTAWYRPDFTVFYEDFSFAGRTVFTEEGIHYVIDGEDFFYEVDCGGGAGDNPIGLGRRICGPARRTGNR